MGTKQSETAKKCKLCKFLYCWRHSYKFACAQKHTKKWEAALCSILLPLIYLSVKIAGEDIGIDEGYDIISEFMNAH